MRSVFGDKNIEMIDMIMNLPFRQIFICCSIKLVNNSTAALDYMRKVRTVFVDGNKRIGMYVMLTFLEVNGIRLDCANDEVVEVGLAVASGAMDYEALLAWVRAHRV